MTMHFEVLCSICRVKVLILSEATTKVTVTLKFLFGKNKDGLVQIIFLDIFCTEYNKERISDMRLLHGNNSG